MKKIFKYFIAIITLFTFITKVNAAGATISVNTSASQIIVGNNITVTVTISSSSPLGSWEYNLNYDKNIFSLVSSDVGLHYAGVVQNNSTKAVSYRYTFKANRSGNASFYIDASTVFGFDESIFEVTNGKRNVRAITYSEYQASLSSNNNLKDIKVEGYEISPVFNKDTLEYTVKVDEDVTKIKVIAYVEDNKAKVNVLYSRDLMDNEVYNNPTSHLIDYLASQGVMMQDDPFIPKGSELKSTDSDIGTSELDSNVNTTVNEPVNTVNQSVNDNSKLEIVEI